MLEGLVLMIISFIITSRVAKYYTNVILLLFVVIITVVICIVLGIAYSYQFAAENRVEVLSRMVGYGFWFSGMGAVYGAFKGRQIGLRRKEHT
jgi:hypothetical protein